MEKSNLNGKKSDVKELAQLCFEREQIDLELFKTYDVKRGLRDLNGKGVLNGLTEI